MTEPRRHPAKVRVPPAWGASIIAGAGAGAVASFASVAVGILIHRQAQMLTFWAALSAGIFGGFLYGWLGRIARRPAAALWVITLVDATTGSFLIAFLPLVSGTHSLLRAPVVGAMAPLRPLIALVSVEHLGGRNFLAPSSLSDMATLYLSAVAVSVLVPRWAKPRDR